MAEEWFEKTEFWRNFGPVMFDAERWAEAPDVAGYVCSIAGLRKGDAVLDAGCGPGRISVELAARGMSVTGVDLIQEELEAAAESAAAEGVSVEFVRGDLRKFVRPEKFRCAVSLFTSFGYCADVSDDLLILKNIAASLEPGGKFILECTGRETAVMYFTEGEWFRRAGMTVLTQFEVVGAWEGLRSKWILISDSGERIEHEFVQRLYSAAELRGLLVSEAGFAHADVYGDFDLSPYDNNARTMVIVAEK